MKDFKKDFPIFENIDVAYLDSGATTQKPKCVIEAIENYYNNYNANPHRGSYELSIEATRVYEEARAKIAKFINAKNVEEIIFTKNATESLNLIAYAYGLNNLKKEDSVVISIMEHHSNLVPWQFVTKKTGSKLEYMYINENFEIPEEEIINKITDKTTNIATNMTIKLEIDNTLYDELKIVVRGDINGDGIVTMTDYAKLKSILLGNPPTYLEFLASDYNKDELIAMTDYTLLKSYLLKTINTLND